jgi:V/A-type H+/Na+-transporting ATPase subunit K
MKAGHKAAVTILLTLAVIVAGSALFLMTSLPAQAQAQAGAAVAAADPDVLRWAFISAALAAGLSALAAGYAVAVVGSAAVGALAEKPELLGRVLILVGLAEGIAIYGLIVAILILNRA